MNERINELYVEAMKLEIGDRRAPEDVLELLYTIDAYDIKFAEVLIRKCAEIANSSTDTCSGGKTIETYFGIGEQHG